MAESKIASTKVAPLNSSADETKKISTIFFDLDNTLIPTRSGDSKACRKLAEVLENQFAFSKEESTVATQAFLKSFRRCPDNSQTSLDSWRTYLWREALPNRCKHLAEQIYPKWLQMRFRYLSLSADYVQMLKRFRESGFLLALITNGPSNAQWEKINELHVSQYFDCVLVSSDLPWEKPNPNIFYAACNFLEVKPANCIMIGDKLESDIKGGRLAGLGSTFWVPLNPAEIDLTDVTHPPDIILKNLLEIYKYFPTLNTNATISTSTNAMATTNSFITLLSNTTKSTTKTCSQAKRRGSQISCSAATSTCDSDLHHHNNHQQYLHKQHQPQQQSHYHIQNKKAQKYRRGSSLPAMEYLNSETENSSDSIFT